MAKNTRKGAASIDAVQIASAEIGHKPPQAPEAEEAVIGAMMLYEECLYQAVGSLKEKSFYNPKLRPIFAAISWLFNHRSAVDITTVADESEALRDMMMGLGTMYSADIKAVKPSSLR